MAKKQRWNIRVRALLGLVLLVLVAFVLTPGRPVGAQDRAWSEPTILEETLGWWPSIAIDPLGAVHAVWGGTSSRRVDVLAYARKDREGWSDRVEVLAGPDIGYTVRSGITVTPDGMVHVVFRRETDVRYSRALLHDALSPLAWMPSRVMGTGAYYADIAADRRGILHVAWTTLMPETVEFGANRNCLACSDVYYRRSEDGGRTWSIPTNLSQSVWGSVKPRIRAYDDGEVYVTWDEGFDWYASHGEPQGVVLAASGDGGVTWTRRVYVGRPLSQADSALPAIEPAWPFEDAPQELAFGKDGAGNLVIAYHRVIDAARRVRDRGVYYQISGDGGLTWSAPAAIEGVLARSALETGLDNYDMARDNQGNLHLVFVGARAEDEAGTTLFHVEWDGKAWLQPEVVYQTSEYVEWPRIAVDSGDGLRLIWHQRRADEVFSASVARTIQIMYAERPGAPLAPATLAPTATPLSTATPLAMPTRIRSTPITTAVPWDGTSVGRSTVDESAVSVVLVATLPVAVFVVVVLLLRGFRIRR